MTNIDSSLRRPILPNTIGGTVPDSKPLLADNPELIMNPGVPRPVYKFGDGDGLTDAFGNVYDGYGAGEGGYTFIWTNNPSNNISEEVDAANEGDLIQFNSSRQLYEPKSIEDACLAKIDKTITPNDGDILVYDSTDGDYKPAPQGTGGGSITFADALFGNIEIPQDRTYRITDGLPFQITVTGNTTSIASGTATVTFPSGVITAGSPIDITISGTNASSEFLRFQLNYTRVIS